jgi:hypothetical protein
MNPDIELVLELQRLDTRIGELRKEIASLPRHIASLERTLDSHIKKLEADRAVLAANQKDRKQQTADIEIHQQKISKLRDQMLSAKTNEQYRAFQHEIEFCENGISKCEDRIIELMEQSEPLEINVKAAQSSLATEKQQVEAEKKVARERTTADEALLKARMAERKAVVEQMTPPVYSRYEKIRKKTEIAVADATTGRCSACQMELRPQFMQDLKKRDSVLLCENCRRIVVYNPPSSPAEEVNVTVNAADGSRVDMS